MRSEDKGRYVKITSGVENFIQEKGSPTSLILHSLFPIVSDAPLNCGSFNSHPDPEHAVAAAGCSKLLCKRHWYSNILTHHVSGAKLVGIYFCRKCHLKFMEQMSVDDLLRFNFAWVKYNPFNPDA